MRERKDSGGGGLDVIRLIGEILTLSYRVPRRWRFRDCSKPGHADSTFLAQKLFHSCKSLYSSSIRPGKRVQSMAPAGTVIERHKDAVLSSSLSRDQVRICKRAIESALAKDFARSKKLRRHF